MVLCAVALNAPQYWRNAQVFGSPLGPGGEGNFRYANDAFSPAILASNALRNLGVHAGTPWPAANAYIERAIAVRVPASLPRPARPIAGMRVSGPMALLYNADPCGC